MNTLNRIVRIRPPVPYKFMKMMNAAGWYVDRNTGRVFKLRAARANRDKNKRADAETRQPLVKLGC